MEPKDQNIEPKKTNWWLPVGIVIVLVLIIGGFSLWSSHKDEGSGEQVKIGVITDLTGPAAYWGASARVGAEMAKKDLEADGYKVDLLFEDYQLDSGKALTSAQKLVNVDKVQGLYAEFNPATYSITPFIKDKNILFVYDAAPTSPLVEDSYAYKSYLDFQKGCKDVATKYKSEGVDKMGFLKLNWEAGEICLAGVKEVYPEDKLVTETFNFGDADVKTQVLKIKNASAGALMNVSLEADTLTVFKAMSDLNYTVPYGTVIDGVADAATKAYPDIVKRTTVFGFDDVSPAFSEKIKNSTTEKIQLEQGTALAYIHITQMVKAIDKCKTDMSCVTKQMDSAKASDIVGFKGFVNRVANFTVKLKELGK